MTSTANLVDVPIPNRRDEDDDDDDGQASAIVLGGPRSPSLGLILPAPPSQDRADEDTPDDDERRSGRPVSRYFGLALPRQTSDDSASSSSPALAEEAESIISAQPSDAVFKVVVARRELQQIIEHIRQGLPRLPASETLEQFRQLIEHTTAVFDTAFGQYYAEFDRDVGDILVGAKESRGLSTQHGILFWVFLSTMKHGSLTLPGLLREELVDAVLVLFKSSSSGGIRQLFHNGDGKPQRSEPVLSSVLQSRYVVVDHSAVWSAHDSPNAGYSQGDLQSVMTRLHFMVECLERGEFDPFINRHLLAVPATLSVNQLGTRDLPTELRRSTAELAYRRVAVGSVAAVDSARQSVLDKMTIGTAAFVKALEYDSKAAQVFMTGISFLAYGASKSRATQKFRESHTSISTATGANNIRSIWNMLDDPGFVKFSAGIMFVSLPKGGMRKIEIRVPKAVLPDSDHAAASHAAAPLANEDDDEERQAQLNIERPADDVGSRDTATTDSNQADDYDVITARILSSRPLPCWNAETPASERVLIVHYHGGGFIAMSSYSHQDYSRRWARQTGFPILSVDYRLAPAYPYPTGMNDCYAAYQWAVEQSQRILGAPPARLVVTGDSAGGACTASVTLQAIANNYRVPDGLLLSYPALNLYRYAMLPSRLLAFKDCILPFAFLDMVIRVYIPEQLRLRAKDEPFLSPGHAPDDWLRRFPPTYIGVGDEDPLYHDSVQFAHRLHRLRRPVGLSVYRGFPHGYLSFSALIKQASKIITETGHQLANLARGTYHSEMMFADDAPVLQVLSPADDADQLFCRELIYAQPHLGFFRKRASPPPPLHHRGCLDLKCADTMYLWRKRYAEVRACYLLVWSDQSNKASFTGAYILRGATFHHDAKNPKYISVTARVPDAKSFGSHDVSLTLWTENPDEADDWLAAFHAATASPSADAHTVADHD